MRRILRFSTVLILTLAAASGVAAPRSCVVPRAETAPRLDGRFDDACWRAVAWETNFTRAPAGPLVAAQCQFAAVWDRENLYLAVRVMEPAIAGIVANGGDGEKGVLDDDHVEVWFAPGADPDRAMRLAVNAAGARALVTGAGATQEFAKPGEAWRVACRKGAGSWDIEMAIPLSDLGLEAKEGGVLAANIAVSRAARPPRGPETSVWSTISKGMSDLGSFGRMTLAPPPEPEDSANSLASRASVDVMTLPHGDGLSGRLLSYSAESGLRFVGSSFRGTLALRPWSVRLIQFGPLARDVPMMRMVLANGDSLRGVVRTIDADATVFDSAATGTLQVPNSAIASIDRLEEGASCVDTLATAADVAPWRPSATTPWLPAPASMPYYMPFNQNSFSTEYEHTGTFTVIADMEFSRGNQSDVRITLQQANPGANFNSNMQFSLLLDGTCLLVMSGAEGQDFIIQAQVGLIEGPLRVCLAYDRPARKVLLWINGKQVGQGRTNSVLPGRVLVMIHGTAQTKRLRLLPGVAFSDEENEEAIRKAAVYIVTAGGDEIAGEAIKLANDVYTLKRAQGELRLDASAVISVRFRRTDAAGAGEKPVRAVAWTTEGRYSLETLEVTEDALIGASPTLGKVRVDRRWLRAIRFEGGR